MPFTTQELFLHVQEHYGITLEKHKFWDLVAAQMPGTLLMHALGTLYAVHTHAEPDLEMLTNDLFLAILMNLSIDAPENVLLAVQMDILFNIWSQSGTRSLSESNCICLAPPLKIMLDQNSLVQHSAIRIISKSTSLWAIFENDMLDISRNRANPHLYNGVIKLAVFRHAPHLLSVKDPTKMYKMMCGMNARVQPTLMSMRHILIGQHNNALAWHTALAVCAPQDPTIAGNWIKMLPAFSALDLDPKNLDSWKFWHLLRECVKDDASGRNLLSCLAETKHEMASAFSNVWSIVNALEEGDARFMRASQLYHTDISNRLALENRLIYECE